MRNCCSVLVLAVATILVGGAPAQAVVLHSEPINGDLSNDRFAPTELTAGVGSNMVIGLTVTTGGVTDLDYFTLFVPAGLSLDAMFLFNYDGAAIAFVAIQQGEIFTEPPDFPNVGNLLGWTHFGADPIFGVPVIDDDLLPVMGAQFGVIGFIPPLPSGSYTFWVQETGAVTSSYAFDFIVSGTPEPPNGVVIPEPASLSLAGLASLLGLVYARQRRRRSKLAAVASAC